MVNFMSVSEAALDLTNVVTRVCNHHDTTTLLVDGKPVAHIVPALAPLTGEQIAAKMREYWPALGVDDAEMMEKELQEARGLLKEPTSPWD